MKCRKAATIIDALGHTELATAQPTTLTIVKCTVRDNANMRPVQFQCRTFANEKEWPGGKVNFN